MEFASTFKQKSTQDKQNLLAQVPDGYVPLIVDRYKATDPPIKRHKFLVSQDATWQTSRIKLLQAIDLVHSSQTINMFIDNRLPHMGETLGNIYDRAQSMPNADGFLYIVYASENTFGK